MVSVEGNAVYHCIITLLETLHLWHHVRNIIMSLHRKSIFGHLPTTSGFVTPGLWQSLNSVPRMYSLKCSEVARNTCTWKRNPNKRSPLHYKSRREGSNQIQIIISKSTTDSPPNGIKIFYTTLYVDTWSKVWFEGTQMLLLHHKCPKSVMLPLYVEQ